MNNVTDYCICIFSQICSTILSNKLSFIFKNVHSVLKLFCFCSLVFETNSLTSISVVSANFSSLFCISYNI